MRKGWSAGRVRTTRREPGDAFVHIDPGSAQHKVRVLTPEAFPTVADIARYRNLTVSAWAPPAARSLADDWLTAVLHSLLDEPHDLFLLGHRPGVLRHLAPDTLPVAMQGLLAALRPTTGGEPLHRISHAGATNAEALLRAGDLNIRVTRTDDATGLPRVYTTHLGRALVRLSAAQAIAAIARAPVSSPLQLQLSCLTNPHSGLRQTSARWLRAIADGTGDGLAITWRQHTLMLLGGQAALCELRSKLLVQADGP